MGETEKSTPAVVTPRLDVEPGQTKSISERSADVTLRFIEQYADTVGPLTPEKEKKLRRKLYFHILTMLIITNLMLFVSDIQGDTRRCNFNFVLGS
jgi:hypothetical protein